MPIRSRREATRSSRFRGVGCRRSRFARKVTRPGDPAYESYLRIYQTRPAGGENSTDEVDRFAVPAASSLTLVVRSRPVLLADEQGIVSSRQRGGRWCDRGVLGRGPGPRPGARVQVRAGHMMTYDATDDASQSGRFTSPARCGSTLIATRGSTWA